LIHVQINHCLSPILVGLNVVFNAWWFGQGTVLKEVVHNDHFVCRIIFILRDLTLELVDLHVGIAGLYLTKKINSFLNVGGWDKHFLCFFFAKVALNLLCTKFTFKRTFLNLRHADIKTYLLFLRWQYAVLIWIVRLEPKLVLFVHFLQTLFLADEIKIWGVEAFLEHRINWDVIRVNQAGQRGDMFKLKRGIISLIVWSLEAGLVSLSVTSILEAVLEIIFVIWRVKKFMTKFFKLLRNLLQLDTWIFLCRVHEGAVLGFWDAFNHFCFVCHNFFTHKIKFFLHILCSVRDFRVYRMFKNSIIIFLHTKFSCISILSKLFFSFPELWNNLCFVRWKIVKSIFLELTFQEFNWNFIVLVTLSSFW